jgi:putative proteasome-type protease
MTYCLGVRVDEGVVLLSDTRTNAGVDHVSRYGKMFSWVKPGEMVVACCTAGNLSITQGVVSSLNAGVRSECATAPSLFLAQTMYDVAAIFGDQMRRMQSIHASALAAAGVGSDASLLVAGQRAGGRHRLFLVYGAGNFIEANDDTPYLQIGEHKYGKPILDRTLTSASEIGDAKKAAYLSMDATIKSNLSVGMPLDLAVIRAGALDFETRRRVWPDDPEFTALSAGWSKALLDAFADLPAPS